MTEFCSIGNVRKATKYSVRETEHLTGVSIDLLRHTVMGPGELGHFFFYFFNLSIFLDSFI